MLSPPSLIQRHRQPADAVAKPLEGLQNRSGAAILKPVEWKNHCGSGGTGRRARLRILWPKGRGGSNPSFRTKISSESKLPWHSAEVHSLCTRTVGLRSGSWSATYATYLIYTIRTIRWIMRGRSLLHGTSIRASTNLSSTACLRKVGRL